MAQQMTPMKTSLETTDDGIKRQPKIYAKNSMDRFGDDLCQLLLSYLSFKDRFRCECVSKQFRRTVFESVVCIEINKRFMQKILKTTITETLATISIKCSKIETIDCRGIRAIYEEHIPEVLAIFRDNCQHLREIYCNLWQNSGQTMPTIGPLVKRINVMPHNIDTQSLIHCHQLSHLFVSRLSEVFDTSGQLMAKNLNKFELCYYSADDYHRLSAFVAQNESLKCLVFGNFLHFETLTEISVHLLRLPQLRELTLKLQIIDNQHLLADFLRTIGVNCKQLKRLTFYFWSGSTQYTLETMDSLQFCQRLKRLELHTMATVDEKVLEPLKHCKRLRYLELHLRRMTANVLKDMHIKCPRLQYLYIRCNAITGECLSHLSRLPALQMLDIQCERNDKLFYDLLSRSPKLKIIKVLLPSKQYIY